MSIKQWTIKHYALRDTVTGLYYDEPSKLWRTYFFNFSAIDKVKLLKSKSAATRARNDRLKQYAEYKPYDRHDSAGKEIRARLKLDDYGMEIVEVIVALSID